MSSEELRRRRAASLRLIAGGSLLLLTGLVTSLVASYQLVPREKVVLLLKLPEVSRGECPLPEQLSEKVYYNVSYSGDRFVDTIITFYDENRSRVGELLIKDAVRNKTGFLYLSGPPSSIVIEARCSNCSTKLTVTLYFVKYNRPLVYTLSIASTVLSLSGSLCLLTGGYAYILYRREVSYSRSSPEEHEKQ